MFVIRIGRNCHEPQKHNEAQQSRDTGGRMDPTMPGGATLDGENDVVR